MNCETNGERGKGEHQAASEEQGQAMPKPTLAILKRFGRQWRREIRERERRRFVQRTMGAILSMSLSHIDRPETFAPVAPPDEIRQFLDTADLHRLEGVLAEVLLNLFTRFGEGE